MSNLKSTLHLQSLRAAGTSEGAQKAWDTRGRKGTDHSSKDPFREKDTELDGAQHYDLTGKDSAQSPETMDRTIRNKAKNAGYKVVSGPHIYDWREGEEAQSHVDRIRNKGGIPVNVNRGDDNFFLYHLKK